MADRIDALSRLAELHRSGALSDEEFASEKRRVLADSDPPPLSPNPHTLDTQYTVPPSHQSSGNTGKVVLIVLSVFVVLFLLSALLGKEDTTSAAANGADSLATYDLQANGSVRAQEETPAEVAIREPSLATTAATPTGPLINYCYRLDYCSYYKVAKVATVVEGDRGRLLRASLIEGDVSHANGTAEDLTRIKWQRRPGTHYVFCSILEPATVTAKGSGFEVYPIDVVSGLGVHANDSNIYAALCHGVFDAPSAAKMARYGYRPMADGEGEPYSVESAAQLLEGKRQPL